jgi:type I restriction enzyme R subunit
VRQVGLLKVLRKGLSDRGIRFRLVYWQPETSINEDTLALYNKNILHCTRQLHYSLSNENSIDIVLFINGIPVVSMELKCQFTGQDIDNAILQYKFDRNNKDTIFDFKNRVLVHFAVDLYNVFMTTRLKGVNTYFLPFNRGSNDAGNVGGKGNPINPNGYQTAYLWETVLCKDRLLEILHKYIHLQKGTIKDKKTGKEEIKETMIFPRYHQLDVVTKLIADVKENGSGKNYLVQHSAGSGKSNSIAWLAYRLSSLHDDADSKIFHSVIVVTDRKILDSQLQDTIYQFDHVDGVVQKVDKNSVQLKDAINGGVSIIITTLQKFPVIYKEVQVASRSFAIIVDEAHSSQTGEAAKKLKKALANTEEILEEYARMEIESEESTPDEQDKILNELAAQGQHKNLSFFAFTATPKDKTLQMFGAKMPDGKYQAFHTYSMRQAIEEGFILDVLKNYMTYKMYYKIVKNITDNPELDSSAGARAIKKYESLHPHNLAQKTAIMIEHFRTNTMSQIGGSAKAMVVTASRLHAVRYLFEFRKYIKDKAYTDLDVLVAFSGEVEDDDDKWTEEKINKNKDGKTIKESQLKEYFHTDDFNMLIVAEKYQTGFDEPYLHTMFVDKKLTGIKAVQTLSRLNRTMQSKDSTFVLDFVNTAEDMQKSFQPFYEATILEQETDPNVIYDLKNTLDEYHIYTHNEIDRFADIFFSGDIQTANDLGKLSATLIPALDRFKAKNDDEKDEFKATLATFIRIYAFITQVCRMFDKEMHKFNVYVRFLQKVLPKGKQHNVDLDDKILMEYYRLEKNFEGSIELEGSEKGITPIKGEAGRKEQKKDMLAQIIERINERFGTTFTEMDKVMLQIENDFLGEERLVNFAKNNDENVFKLIFEQEFKEKAAARYEMNEEFFVHMFNDCDFMQYMMDLMRSDIYKKLRKQGK